MAEQLTDYRLDVCEKRIDDHGKRLDELQDLMTRLAAIEEQNQRRIDEQEKRVKDLEAVPVKRWDSVVSYLITAILALVVGFFASNIGLS